ncbi:hypothetical protein B7755_025975 [Streptomyces sp. NBS 14/10]|uniref:hypothetical protein n=1 Tax=Streptomyces sp. NBS 14/10 TaxID=1945643 RepID=UPI000B9C8699|nr:hypothetical protein [Streptomyces sp. NBS 14/10]KAK1181281.1 hypothetical protein B7755_025975 [Streptomyces sp. NBS 14/10]
MPVAVRLPRTAAARRALLAALFLGGFLALAFLFGGSAHAADRTDPGGAVDSSATSGLLDTDSADDAAQATKATDDAAQVANDAARRSRISTLRDAVRPVEKQTRELTEPVTDLLDQTGRSLPVHLPSDVLGGAGDDTGPSGSVPAQQPSDGHQAKGDKASGHQAARAATRMGPTAPRSAATAPRTVTDHDRAPVVRAAHGPAQGDGVPAPLPFPFPAGSPAGAVAQCTSDSGAPRGGDTHAALVPGGQASHWLRPGAVRAESSAPTRERFNEVLEFPG